MNSPNLSWFDVTALAGTLLLHVFSSLLCNQPNQANQQLALYSFVRFNYKHIHPLFNNVNITWDTQP